MASATLYLWHGSARFQFYPWRVAVPWVSRGRHKVGIASQDKGAANVPIVTTMENGLGLHNGDSVFLTFLRDAHLPVMPDSSATAGRNHSSPARNLSPIVFNRHIVEGNSTLLKRRAGLRAQAHDLRHPCWRPTQHKRHLSNVFLGRYEHRKTPT